MQVNIKKFKPKKINQYRLSKGPPTIAIIGKRGTGKSTLVADLLYHTRKIPKGVVMSATEESNEFYSNPFVSTENDKEYTSMVHYKGSIKSCYCVLQCFFS